VATRAIGSSSKKPTNRDHGTKAKNIRVCDIGRESSITMTVAYMTGRGI
jgi:hypothetical protein